MHVVFFNNTLFRVSRKNVSNAVCCHRTYCSWEWWWLLDVMWGLKGPRDSSCIHPRRVLLLVSFSFHFFSFWFCFSLSYFLLLLLNFTAAAFILFYFISLFHVQRCFYFILARGSWSLSLSLPLPLLASLLLWAELVEFCMRLALIPFMRGGRRKFCLATLSAAALGKVSCK